MTMRTVLLVDDEPALLEVLQHYLRDEGFGVVLAVDGPSALEAFRACSPHLVLLDVHLPGFSGIEVLRRIREIRNVPVIMLTSRAQEMERIVGLELGADDYIGKPFSPREVVARVRSVLRRAARDEPATPSNERRIGGVTIDTTAHEVYVRGKRVSLTPMQFKILDVLASHAGQTLTREQIMQIVSADGDAFDRTLDRHIGNIRACLESDPARPRHILTVFGVGYKMVNSA